MVLCVATELVTSVVKKNHVAHDKAKACARHGAARATEDLGCAAPRHFMATGLGQDRSSCVAT